MKQYFLSVFLRLNSYWQWNTWKISESLQISKVLENRVQLWDIILFFYCKLSFVFTYYICIIGHRTQMYKISTSIFTNSTRNPQLKEVLERKTEKNLKFRCIVNSRSMCCSYWVNWVKLILTTDWLTQMYAQSSCPLPQNIIISCSQHIITSCWSYIDCLLY